MGSFFDNLLQGAEAAGTGFIHDLAGAGNTALQAVQQAPVVQGAESAAGSAANFLMGTNTALSPGASPQGQPQVQNAGQTQSLAQAQASGPSYGTTLDKAGPTVAGLATAQLLAPVTGGASELLVPDTIGGSALLGKAVQAGTEAMMSNTAAGTAQGLASGQSPQQALSSGVQMGASMAPIGMASLIPGEGVLGASGRLAAGSALGAGGAAMFGQNPWQGALFGALGSNAIKPIDAETVQQTLEQAKQGYQTSALGSEAGFINPKQPFSNPEENTEAVKTPDDMTTEAQEAAVMKSQNVPAMANFEHDPEGNDAVHTFTQVQDTEGLMNDLAQRGIDPSAMTASSNTVAIMDPENKLGGNLRQAAEQYNMKNQLSSSKGYLNILSQEQLDEPRESQPDLSSTQAGERGQSDAISALGGRSPESPQNGNDVQAPILSKGKPTETGQSAESAQVLDQKLESVFGPEARPIDDKDQWGLDGREQIIQKSRGITPEEAAQAKVAALEGPKAVEELSHDQQVFLTRDEAQHSDPSGNELKEDTLRMREQAGIPRAAQVPEEDVPKDYQTSAIKAITDTTTRRELQVLKDKARSPEVQTIAQRIEDHLQSANNWTAPALTKLEDARKTIPKDYTDAVKDAESGTRGTPADKWIQAKNEVAQDIAEKAQALGFKVYDPVSKTFNDFDPRDNFFPHYIQQDVLQTLKSNKITPFAQKMIDDGKAANLTEVKQFIRQQLGNREVNTFGHLETGRTDNDLPYSQDPKMFEAYAKQAYDRLSWASQFGNRDEELNRFIGQAQAKGDTYGAENAQRYANYVGNLNRRSITEDAADKFVSGVRNAETVSELQFVGLKHLTNLPRIMAQQGFGNFVKALPEIVNGEAKELARNTSIALHDDLKSYDFGTNGSKITQAFLKGVGLKNVQQFSREMTVQAAKLQVDDFIKPLQNEGGELSAKAQRFFTRAGLDPQKIQERGGVTTDEFNRYANDALQKISLYFPKGSIPAAWHNNAAGKLFSMFKHFGYNDLVKGIPPILDEAKHGNALPLAIMLAGVTGAGMGYNDVRHTITNMFTPPDQRAPNPSFMKQLVAGAVTGGIGGLVGEQLGSAIEYPKYIPSDLVSFLGGPAAGTAYNAAQAVAGLATGNSSESNPAISSLIGQVPVIGQAIANPLANQLNPYVSQGQQALSKLFASQNINSIPGTSGSSTNQVGVGAGSSGGSAGVKHSTRGGMSSQQRAGARMARSSIRRAASKSTSHGGRAGHVKVSAGNKGGRRV